MTGDPAALPQNLNAEEHILCAMLNSPAAIDTVQQIVQPRDFHRDSHVRIYRAIVELHTDGTPVDPITVGDHLAGRKQLSDAGGHERIVELGNLMLPVSNAAHHARIVERMARFRDLIRVGAEISALGWEASDVDTSSSRAQELAAGLEERAHPDALTVETWRDFEAQAHDQIPVLVQRLWPEAAFGFVAAPPKKGKTWIALALSIAVATGKPLFGHFIVPKPRPVLYVALEGHRAALRARVGAIARGMGIDPDPQAEELTNLHWLYKPRGINLADQRWADKLRRAADRPEAALIAIDVLRAGARIKESDQEQFTNFRHNLQPISDDGRSLAVLHHFTKLSELSKERDPGERMSGSGAMFGALDVGIYITGSDNQARKLRIDFDTRDIATPKPISIELVGTGTGDNGGFTYRDTATWQMGDQEVSEDDLKAPPQDIYDWLVKNGGQATSSEIRFAFQVSDRTVRDRETRLQALGVELTHKSGRATEFRVMTDEEIAERDNPQVTSTSEVEPPQHTPDTLPGFPISGVEPHNHAGLPDTPTTPETKAASGVGKAGFAGETLPPHPGTPIGVDLGSSEVVYPDANGHQKLTDQELEQIDSLTTDELTQEDLDALFTAGT